MAEGTGLEPYSPCQSLVRGQGGFQDVQACVDLTIHFPVTREAHEILAHPISAPSATHWAEIGVRRRPVSRSNEYDWFAAMSRGFLTSGGELFRFFLMRRRWPFSKPRATSNADRIYFLCTRCSARSNHGTRLLRAGPGNLRHGPWRSESTCSRATGTLRATTWLGGHPHSQRM